MAALELVYRAENRCKSSGGPAEAFPRPPRGRVGPGNDPKTVSTIEINRNSGTLGRPGLEVLGQGPGGNFSGISAGRSLANDRSSLWWPGTGPWPRTGGECLVDFSWQVVGDIFAGEDLLGDIVFGCDFSGMILRG